MSEVSTSHKNQFGLFKGVFTPSILTILGVIMFLRMGWVVGHMGLFKTIVIVTVGSSITLLTAFSISATATNMKVGGGGAYFMISRSLGVEAGAAVGIPLYLAQTFGIAFYLAGFSESLQYIFPQYDPIHISIAGLVFLTLLAYLSANFALKIQFIIMTLIALSLVSFFAGDYQSATLQTKISSENHLDFWYVFAVFFPAVTGIEAGLSLSGDLKDPAKSLPWGTIYAVLVGYVIYLAIPVFMYFKVPEHELVNNLTIMNEIARWKSLILLGVLGASLSSALGALLGAPRTLQALAKDNVVPKFFATGGASPTRATILSFIIALIAIVLGDLNAIAPILSMFFLTSYGMLNGTAAVESLIANPSWRPEFKFPWYISAIGALSCFMVMFMISSGATIISLFCTLSVYYIMQKRKMTARWGDIRRGILGYLAKFSIEKLAQLPMNLHSWRPNIIVLSGSPSKRWYLVELGHAIASRSGFLTVATIIPQGSQAENRMTETQDAVREYLSNRSVPAFVRISSSDDVMNGVISLVRNYGLGPLTPNTVIIGETEDQDSFESFAEMLIKLYQMKRNIIIVRVPDEFIESQKKEVQLEELKNLNFYFTHNKNKKISVWWGRQRNNAALGLAMGYLLQESEAWNGAGLSLKSVTTEASEVPGAEALLKTLIEESRLNAEPEVYLHLGSRREIFDVIRNKSMDSGFVFIGVLPPDLAEYEADKETAIKKYAQYYEGLLKNTEGFPPLAMVLAAEELSFHKIFVS